MKRAITSVCWKLTGEPDSKRANCEEPSESDYEKFQMDTPLRYDNFKIDGPEITVFEKPYYHDFAFPHKVGKNTPDRIQTVAHRIDAILRNINAAFVFNPSYAEWVGTTSSVYQTTFDIRLWGENGDLILEMNRSSGDRAEFINLQMFINKQVA